MLPDKTRWLFSILAALLGLIGIIYCYYGLVEPWSEHRFNDSYMLSFNPSSEFQTINGTTTFRTLLAGNGVMFVCAIYICGLSCVSVSCLAVIVYFCREGKDCNPTTMSTPGSICLWLSLMLWLPIHKDWDYELTLTLTWYRLIIITSINLLVHTIGIGVYCCRKRTPRAYVELPEN